jgi:hypothetical protein
MKLGEIGILKRCRRRDMLEATLHKNGTFENALSLCLQRSGTKLAALSGLFVKCRRCKKVFKRTIFIPLGYRRRAGK